MSSSAQHESREGEREREPDAGLSSAADPDREPDVAHDSAAHLASASQQDVITVRDVSKTFGDTHALRSCSFSARAGEIHALVGGNGSGKSTLAKIMSGIYGPDSGEVEVLGGFPASPAAATRLGLATVFQEILVCEGQSVLDNLYVGTDGLLRRSGPESEKLRRGQELLSRLLGRPLDLHARVESLPLGQRQWITIARALLREPKVLVLDEATAALDLDGSKLLFEIMRELKAAGVCVLLVTHRIAELTTFADRATVLRDGVNVGTVERAHVSEQRLLELMTGEQVDEQGRARARARMHAGRAPRAMITARRLRLSTHTEPFDIEVDPGEIVGVIGLDGHGQDAFIRALAGIVAAVDGRVEVATGPDGADRAAEVSDERSAARCGIAYISGDRKLEGIFPNLSVLENFGVALQRRNSVAGVIRRGRIREAFRAGVEALSIRLGRAAAPIGTLSGGNQQKVLIARALATEPRVVLLNDPTRGVDIPTKHDLYDLLERLAADGKAVVFLSSEIDEFLGLCDRVAVFRNGSLFTTVPAAEISIDHVLAAMFGQSGGGGLTQGNGVAAESKVGA